MQLWKDRPLVLIALSTLLIMGMVLWAAFALVGPTPPRTLTMSTGPQGGDYDELGGRYQMILAQEGIKLRLLPSNGSVENLARLRDPQSGVDVAFVQGGYTNEAESPDLVSLGSLFQEPVWVFYRGFEPDYGKEWYRGLRFSIGAEGSATRPVALELLALNGIPKDAVTLLGLSPPEAEGALLRGEIDVAVMVSSWDMPIVRRLVAAEGVELMSFPRAKAYQALFPFLTPLVLPEGVGDMARNRPPSDVTLIATETSLIIRKELHPAIQYLLLQAATRIHSGPGIFRTSGQYPSPEAIDLPLSENALQYYKSGPPFLQRYLPLWVSVLVVRLVVVLIPLVAVLFPLLKSAPKLYDWQMRRRVYKSYGQLKFLEAELDVRDRTKPVDDLIAELDELEHRASHIKVPLAYSHLSYTLRLHIRLVRERLDLWQRELEQDRKTSERQLKSNA